MATTINDIPNDIRDSNDLVFHDGFYIKEEDIIKAAMRVGDFGMAEHYMNSLLFHALKYGKTYLLKEVNDIRKNYNTFLFELPEESPASNDNMPGCWNQETKMMAEVRKRYQALGKDEQVNLLKCCLTLLMANSSELFKKKADWIGIFMVIRDRLDGLITQKDFYDLAQHITPDDWPSDYRISSSTMSNYGRYVPYKHRDECYYEMEDNLWRALCDAFWNIVQQQIMTDN